MGDLPELDLSTEREYATFLQPAYDEMRAIQAWEQRQRRADTEVATWTPGRAYELARLAAEPVYAPAVAVALAGAGFTGEDALSQFAAREAWLQRNENATSRLPLGAYAGPNLLEQGTPRARYNAEVQAAYALGMFNEDGLLEEPTERNQRDPFYRQFVRVQEAAEALGEDLPYLDYEGRPTVLRVSPGHQMTNEQLATRDEEALRVAGERLGRRELPGSPVEREAIQHRIEGEERARVLEEVARAQAPSSRIEHLDEEGAEAGGGMAAQVGRGAGEQLVADLGGEALVRRTATAGVNANAIEVGLETLKDSSRYAFTVLDAPVQEAQGQFRNVIAAVHGRGPDWLESQSDFGINLGRSLRGEPQMSAGNGFFADPQSELGQERLRRERERGLIGGQVITLGRWGASQVVEPGTTPYRLLSGMVDAAVQVVDPSALLLKPLGAAGKGSRFIAAGDDALEAAGALRGVRRMIHGVTAEAFLDGPQGRRIIEDLAGEAGGNATRVWRYLNRKVDPRLAAQIADTTDMGEIADLLSGQLGITFRHAGELPWGRAQRWAARATEPVTTPGGWVQRTQTPGLRQLVNRMPGQRINLNDPQSAMVEMEAWLRNARVPETQVEHFLDRLARVDNRQGVYGVVREAAKVGDGVLAKAGITDPDVRDELLRMWDDTHEAVRHYFVDRIGDDVDVWGNIVINGEEAVAPSPHLLVEHANDFIPLPGDARTIRRLTSRYKHILAKGTLPFERAAAESVGELRLPLATLDFLQSRVWKPFTLLRGAWTARVVGDEQLRMAGAGFDNMFTHPLSFISWRMGRRGGTDLAGDAFSEAAEHTQAMTKVRGTWIGDAPNRVPHMDFLTYSKAGHRGSDFRRAWGEELAKLHADPVARQVARSENLQEVTEWFTDGAGQLFRRQLVAAHPELADDRVARNYIESISERIGVKTGNSPELLDVVRTGKLNGKAVLEAGGMRHRDLSRGLTDYLDSAPDSVVGRRFTVDPTKAGHIGAAYDRVTDMLFGALMGKRTNNLSRSPTFRQAYWRRAEELIPFADEAAKAQLIEAARRSNLDLKIPTRLGSRPIRRMERTAARGELNLAEIDVIAKGYGLDETKRLLYDLTERSQFFDAMRVIFPFGEAWKEMFGRWGQLIKENPAIPRRAQQLIEGARGEDFGEVMGAPPGKGFFYENQFGEEVFAYPGSQMFTRATLGVPIPLSGRVQGLNMMGSVMPGLGPVAQLPASALIPDKPGWGRTARELLMPFGSPSDEGGMEAWTEMLNFAPAWLKRGWQAVTGEGYNAETDRIYNNTVMDVARYLESTGRYDLSSREGMQELLEDAREKATRFYGIRSLAQFVAPSAPGPEFLVETDEGVQLTAALAEEFHEMTERDPDSAVEDFLDLYGDNVTLVMVAKSRTVVAGLDASQEVADWVDENQDLIDQYPTTWAFFAPQGGEFDHAVYVNQIKRGQRQPLTPEQWLRARNNMLGSTVYRKAQRMAGPNLTDESRVWLNEVRADLRHNYPGYGDRTGFVEAADTDYLIEELGRIVQDPRVRGTGAGQGLATYMQAREMAQQEGRNRGLTGRVSYASAQSARDLRDWLRQVANRITTNHPDFDSLWMYLQDEMEDDAEVTDAA